ncbi:hypothetical protein SEP1_157 [Staphylococcus phage phiIBB-SEP1]|uniref:Uncharacterized protein n=1 Tax=Staphylococcus phage phiIBB-SEP1 TaxID=1340769 RepID=W5RAT1_9CAUD|nr:hypothetical protein FDH45_gp156 [Staphylococcus phage phiIBB-SEP1]AGR48284.1 hypothetical protein SEP1_157 [Staphylococcus phage phiIBB-SEP1]
MSKYEKEIEQFLESESVKIDYGTFELEFEKGKSPFIHLLYKGLPIDTLENYLIITEEYLQQLFEKYEYYPKEYFEDKLTKTDKRIKKRKIGNEILNKTKDLHELSSEIEKIIKLYEEAFNTKEEYLFKEYEIGLYITHLDEVIQKLNKYTEYNNNNNNNDF